MIGVVIVTWNSEDVIGPCLDACLAAGGCDVVVVDNASSDRTVEQVKLRSGVRLLPNSENRGFAGGVNQGVRALPHPAILLLNPDARPVSGLAALAETVLEPGVGAAGGSLVNEDGSPQTGFNVRAFPTAAVLALEVLGLNRLLPFNPWNREYRRQPAGGGVHAVDQPAGAFLMLNREAWAATNGFDESFHPAWFEDVDYCRRLFLAGYRVLYVPGAVACHAGGHSASRLTWHDRQLFWYGSLVRYARKHFSAPDRRLVLAALMMACTVRAVWGLLSGKRMLALAVYSKVFRVALRCWRDEGTGVASVSSGRGESSAAVQS